MKIKKQKIIPGQSNLIDSTKESFNKDEYMLRHMEFNTAFTSLIDKKKNKH